LVLAQLLEKHESIVSAAYQTPVKIKRKNMLGFYFKSALRSIGRKKVFSILGIAGLGPGFQPIKAAIAKMSEPGFIGLKGF
jgi:hypothetical protein